MFSLHGKTALVTGATGGLGQSIAYKLHERGATVILSGTKENVLNEVASKLERVHVLPCSLKDADQVNALFDKAESLTGQVDILVNNAGITRDTLSIRMKDEEWEEVLLVNLTSAFRLCRSALKAMMKRRYGRIINISSVVGVMGNPGQANYCASKAGLIGMTKSLAKEVASRNVTINCVAPGFITTPMTDQLNEVQSQKMLDTIPMGRFGIPDDISAPVCFLASEESSYITGQTIHVNGGMVMV
jgi:3-oxoacyl-[acyl-carrier protein] reductase